MCLQTLGCRTTTISPASRSRATSSRKLFCALMNAPKVGTGACIWRLDGNASSTNTGNMFNRMWNSPCSTARGVVAAVVGVESVSASGLSSKGLLSEAPRGAPEVEDVDCGSTSVAWMRAVPSGARENRTHFTLSLSLSMTEHALETPIDT